MLLRLCTPALMLLLAVPASADLRTMGQDYRQMKTNYHILHGVSKECPDLALPELVSGGMVDKTLQEKLGPQQFVQVQMAIQRSDLQKNAQTVTQQLLESVEDCDDPRLSTSMQRLEQETGRASCRERVEAVVVRVRLSAQAG